MTATIAERVAAGAALLDEAEPGWDQRIDLDLLDIMDSCGCPAGQPDGRGYGAGLTALGLAEESPARLAELGFHWGAAFGDIDALNAAWRELIEARRAA
jgi:hypothetical protein